MAMTREQLNQAFREVASMEFVDIPCDEALIQFHFSDKFNQKMERLIARQKKPYWEYVNTAKKRAAIVAIVCLSLFITACSNEAFREPILRQVERLGGNVRDYILEGDVKKIITYQYQMTVLPDGFEKTYEEEKLKQRWVRYEDEDKNTIKFYQCAAETPYFNVVDTWINEHTIEIRGLDVKVFEFSNMMYAIWVEDGYGMSLIYNGCNDIEMIKEIIEGIE